MNVIENQLIDGIKAILGDGGLLESRGFVYQKNQLKYAINAGMGLIRGTEDKASMSLLEAATGTGKTLGYTVPLVLYAALTGKRCAIATYTLHLQRQIFTDDLPEAVAMVQEYLGKAVTFKRRFGLANFISKSRLDSMLSEMDRKKSDGDYLISTDLEKFAKDSLKNKGGKSGEIAEFMAEHLLESLPYGLRPEQICLNSDSTKSEKRAYLLHAKAASNADIVITTQAMLSVHIRRSFSVLDGERPISALVVDEADKFPEVAESMLSRSLSIHEICRLLGKFDHPSYQAAKIIADAYSDHLAALRKTLGDTDMVFVDEHGGRIAKETTQLATALAELPYIDVIDDIVLRDQMRELQVYCEKMKDMVAMFNGDKNAKIKNPGRLTPLISFSPSRKYPSLILRPANVGFFLARLWLPRRIDFNDPASAESLYLESCIMTSATLGDPAKKMEDRFKGFMISCGIFDRVTAVEETGIKSTRSILNINDDLFLSASPMRFGKMRFILADPRLPKPLMQVDDEDNALSDELTLAATQPNPIWLDYVIKAISHANKQSGGRTLVLTNSHRDTELFAQMLSELPDDKRPRQVLTHLHGQKINEAIAIYKRDGNSDAVLISAGAWEGVNLPDMVQNLVITRLPYGGIDAIRNRIFTRWLQASRGKSAQQAKSILWMRTQASARRKLSQGLGRGIRSATDKCNVYITDPRFPVISTDEMKRFFGELSENTRTVAGDVSFHRCVPERFQDELISARVLCKDGTIFDPAKYQKLAA